MSFTFKLASVHKKQDPGGEHLLDGFVFLAAALESYLASVNVFGVIGYMPETRHLKHLGETSFTWTRQLKSMVQAPCSQKFLCVFSFQSEDNHIMPQKKIFFKTKALKSVGQADLKASFTSSSFMSLSKSLSFSVEFGLMNADGCVRSQSVT